MKRRMSEPRLRVADRIFLVGGSFSSIGTFITHVIVNGHA